MTKLNGAEWKAFYSDKTFWPEGEDSRIHDDVVIHLNGQPSNQMMADPDSISDTDELIIESGYVATRQQEYICDLDWYFKGWKEKQTSVSFVVTCEPGRVRSIQAAIFDAGGEIQ